jgi:hypothetical protein
MSELGPDTCGEHLIDTRALIDAVTRAVQMAVPEDEAEAEGFWETCGAALNLLFVCVDAAKRRQETARATPAPVFFRSKFRWEPGEYVLTLNVKAEPERASVSSRNRITLFESDSKELTGYCDGYKFGYGVFLDSPKRTGIIVPIAEGYFGKALLEQTGTPRADGRWLWLPRARGGVGEPFGEGVSPSSRQRWPASCQSSCTGCGAAGGTTTKCSSSVRTWESPEIAMVCSKSPPQ